MKEHKYVAKYFCFHKDAGDEQLQNSRTIEVRKFNPTTSDETFETFFENKRRTGGGGIEKIDADDRAKGIIRVTFVEAGGEWCTFL